MSGFVSKRSEILEFEVLAQRALAKDSDPVQRFLAVWFNLASFSDQLAQQASASFSDQRLVTH
ncbi:hypothetical protein A2U01_0096322 [Trifolium medium]|uniref:Uncharacterized protein n=1 Tax=Trifolium medium TaxID=97028 RepID=A0A392UTE4_9FABA|nr:hypothetical protein [Trifolium medium]